MPQNRKKIIDLFIGNFSNVIIHEVLSRSTDVDELSTKYNKESENSLDLSLKYRNKINPKNDPIPHKDQEYIRSKVINRTTLELKKRISEGYKNINLELVENLVDEFLRSSRVV